jgi:hypothetical protein
MFRPQPVGEDSGTNADLEHVIARAVAAISTLPSAKSEPGPCCWNMPSGDPPRRMIACVAYA